MFFRTNIFKQLKGFDERFLYYMEDVDLSRRTVNCSTRIVPSVRIVHNIKVRHTKIKN